MDKESILKLSEMSEEEQWQALYQYAEDYWNGKKIWKEFVSTYQDWRNLFPGANCNKIRQILADLAFQLQGKAVGSSHKKYRSKFTKALEAVYCYVHKQDVNKGWTDGYYQIYRWFTLYAKPIHWIQAALLVQSEEKK